MQLIRIGKQALLFCSILIFLFLISPACACPGCTLYVSIIPIPIVLSMAAALATTALMFNKRRGLTFFLIILSFIVLQVLGCFLGLGIMHYPEVSVLGMVPILIGLNLIYISFDEKEGRFRQVVSGATVAAVILGIALIVQMSRTCRFLFVGNFLECHTKLKNLGTAVETYSVDHNGKYPDTLTLLVPTYLNYLHRCIDGEVSEKTKNFVKKMYGKTIDDYRYTVSSDRSSYTMWCSGTNHSDIRGYPGYPQYNSEQGLIVGR